MEYATEGGSIECMKYVYEEIYNRKGKIYNINEIKEIKFDFYSQDQNHIDGRSICTVAAGKNLECLKYAISLGFPVYNYASENAAFSGRLDCLKFLHENEYDWNVSTSFSAARSGNLECLKYLMENGCAFSTEVCDIAVTYGKFECLKYLHGVGMILNKGMSRAAAENDHIECLKYLLENGCEWDEETTFNSRQNKCFQYAEANDLACILYE
jgi:hypothetical protein